MATLWPICALLWLAIGISCDSSPTIVQTPESVIQRPNSKVSLNCNVNGAPNPNIYWYRQIIEGRIQLLAYSVAVGSSYAEGPDHIEGSRLEDTKFFLSIKNLMADDTGIYYCAWSRWGTTPLIFGQGTRLTVLGPDQDVSPPQVTVFAPPKQEVDEKEKATIVCLVTDFYPDHVALSWTVNNKTRTAGVKTEDPVYDNTTERYSMTSRLRITKEEWQNSDNKFVCRVSFHGTEGSTDYEDDINGADCGGGSKAARESYLTEANLGKLVYILLVFKSTLYGAFVMGLKLRKKLAP